MSTRASGLNEGRPSGAAVIAAVRAFLVKSHGHAAVLAERDCRRTRCKGIDDPTAARAFSTIGRQLAASALRSLNLQAWLPDGSVLQHVPATLQVRRLPGL